MSYRYAGTQWQRATLKGLFTAGVSESLEGSFLTHTRPPPLYEYTGARQLVHFRILKSLAPVLHVRFFPENFTPRAYIITRNNAK